MSQQRICIACGGYFTPRQSEPLICRECMVMENFQFNPASTSASTSADREVSPHTPESPVACGDSISDSGIVAHSSQTQATGVHGSPGPDGNTGRYEKPPETPIIRGRKTLAKDAGATPADNHCQIHSTSTEAVVGSGTEPGANKDHWMLAAEQQLVDSGIRFTGTPDAIEQVRRCWKQAFLAGADYAIKRCKESVGQLFDPKE